MAFHACMYVCIYICMYLFKITKNTYVFIWNTLRLQQELAKRMMSKKEKTTHILHAPS